MALIPINIAELVGDTPMVELRRLGTAGARVLVKIEYRNPCGSVKDLAIRRSIVRYQYAQPLFRHVRTPLGQSSSFVPFRFTSVPAVTKTPWSSQLLYMLRAANGAELIPAFFATNPKK